MGNAWRKVADQQCRKKSDNSPPATFNGDGKEEEPCDLIRVLPHTISKRKPLVVALCCKPQGFVVENGI